jgi:hypothetical protein
MIHLSQQRHNNACASISYRPVSCNLKDTGFDKERIAKLLPLARGRLMLHTARLARRHGSMPLEDMQMSTV